MKKFQIVFLIVALIFTLSSCGNKDAASDDNLPDNPISSDEGIEAEDESTDEESVTKLDPDELTLSEDAYTEDEIRYDYGAEVSADYPMAGLLEKVDYSNITGLGDVLLSNCEKTIGSNFSEKKFESFSDYEEDVAEEIDRICYVMSMENNDTESAFIETGAYHYTPDNTNHQYVTYFTKTYTSANSFDIDSSLKELEKFGVSVSKSKLKAGVQETFSSIGKDQYEYTLIETVPFKDSKCSGYVKVGIYGGEMEDGTIAAYAVCERDIVYK